MDITITWFDDHGGEVDRTRIGDPEDLVGGAVTGRAFGEFFTLSVSEGESDA